MNYKAHDLAKKLLELPNYFVAVNGYDDAFCRFEIVEDTFNSAQLNYLDSNEMSQELYDLYDANMEEEVDFPLILINYKK